MDEAAVLEIARDAVIVVLKVATPVMLISLIAPLLWSCIATATSKP